MKISQTESRMLVKWVERNYGVKIGNGFYFWRMTPEEVVEAAKDDFEIKITVKNVLDAIKA